MFEALTSKIKGTSEFALDLETTGFNPRKDRILGAALAVEGHAEYVEFTPNTTTLDRFREEFGTIFSDTSLRMVLHNAKFDLSFLNANGIYPKNPIADTMIASHMVDENTRNGLKECVKREFDYKMTTFDEVGGLFGDEMATYAEDDARQTLRLWNHYKPTLEEEGTLKGFFDIEMPLIPVIMEMENTGSYIDSLLLVEYGRKLKEKVALCERRIFEYAGMPFDIASPKQLSGILYGKMALPYRGLEMGKNGCYPTNDVTLQLFKADFPIVNYILDWRRYTKLLTTYVKPILNAINAEERRLRARFWQTGTATGRLSSSDPNLQNIPNDKEFPIRKSFIAPEGKRLIVADYSQIELRLLAHVSQEEVLLKAYRTGGDVHQETADLIGCDRKSAKTINFGLLYGMGPKKLARSLGISDRDAFKFMDTYFKKLPSIRGYIQAVHDLVRNQGWVRTLICHRRRRFREIDNRAERQAVNFIIQGSAADLMKKALADMYRRFKADDQFAEVRLLMTIHDEVVVEAPTSIIDIVAEIVRESMDNAWRFSIPTPCSLEICDSWDEGK